MKTQRHLLTVPQAAAAIGRGRSTLDRWKAKGVLHRRERRRVILNQVQVGGNVFIKPVDLLEFLHQLNMQEEINSLEKLIRPVLHK